MAIHFDILTLFPAMVKAPLGESILGKAAEKDFLKVAVHNLRDWAEGRHQVTDDTPYGGGAGMVMKVEPVARAIESLRSKRPGARVLLMSPQGQVFRQATAERLSREPNLVFVCGRYEGFDERIRALVDEELSLGDFVLTGGEFAALTMIDAIARLVPGVLGAADSAETDSFSDGLLEYPQYTRPAEFAGECVPEVLLSGNHREIDRWRRREQLRRTLLRRPDLLSQAQLSEEDHGLLAEIRKEEGNEALKCCPVAMALVHYPVLDRHGEVVSAAVTNLDIHDLSRLATTYRLQRFYLVTPVVEQQKLINRILVHWKDGFGAGYNADRCKAMELVQVFPSFAKALEDWRSLTGPEALPLLTGARQKEGIDDHAARDMASRIPLLITLGTGHGLASPMYEAGWPRLNAIRAGGYNHLSVRTAAAIILDRLLGEESVPGLHEGH